MSTRSQDAATFDPARRRLLGGAAAAGTVAAIAASRRADAASWTLPMAATATGRSGALLHLISLAGAHAGQLVAAEGGFPFLEVGPYQLIPGEKEPMRLVTNARCQPLEVTFGTGMSAAWYQAIARGLTYRDVDTPLSGEVLSVSGSTSQAVARLTYHDATVTQLVLPALRSSTVEPLTFRATLQPAATQYMPQGGPVNAGYGAVKRATANAYRLSIRDIEQATHYASSIDPITLKVTRTMMPGKERVAVPAVAIEASNLVFRTPLNRAQPLFQWFDSFRQQPTVDQMRPGILQYMDYAGAQALGTISFERLGIVRVGMRQTPEFTEIETEMYCEGVSLNLAAMA